MIEQKMDELKASIEELTSMIRELNHTLVFKGKSLPKAEEPKAEKETPAPVVQVEELDPKDAFVKAVKKNKKAVVELLANDFGAKKFADVPEDQHADLVAKLGAL